MKNSFKLLSLSIILFSKASSVAQVFSPASGILWANPITTNVGIGTSSPFAPLNVVGANVAPSAGTANGGAFSVGGNGTNAALQFGVYSVGTPYAWIQSRNQTTTTNFYDLSLQPLGGSIRVNDRKIYLRGSGITTCGLGWDALNTGIDGPVLFGGAGGSLSTLNGGSKTVLGWDNSGYVTVPGSVEVGPIYMRSSAIQMQLWANDKTGLYLTTRHAANYGIALKIDVDKNLTKAIEVNNGGAINFQVYGDGAVFAREVKVMLGTFVHPDYVFEKNYKLMSLPELEKFLASNKHLPNVPSVAEVEKNNGINLGEMSTKQLEKIEELTLYIIELNKKLVELDKVVKAQQEKIEVLESK
jgi:hypothetical protein